MKHFVIALALGGLMVASPLFASGATEEESTADIPWETITVTGEISFQDLPHPEITSGGTTYEISAPRVDPAELGIEAGDTITVTGVLVDGRAEEDEPVLMVLSAEINGEEFTVPLREGGRGPRGGRGSDKRGTDRPRGGDRGGR